MAGYLGVKGKTDMMNKDKVIAAFLVSVGIFSTVQAWQYVQTLSTGEKTKLFSVAKVSDTGVLVCESPIFDAAGDPKKAG